MSIITHRLSKLVLAIATVHVSIMSAHGASQHEKAPVVKDIITLETTVVTATREAKPQREAVDTVSINNADEIKQTLPTHPADLLNRNAGVHINNLGGEGHMTSIRQPITTGGVYLFLEDGIPTRPTGMFNHNGLYEINMPQAQRVEVVKGPGSALYGSDSIGGIINTITKPSSDENELSFTSEVGSNGWTRWLGTTSGPLSENLGARLDVNYTKSDGVLEESDYSRLSTTARLDGYIGDNTTTKTILSYSQIEQSGVASQTAKDYFTDSQRNVYHNDVGRRDVDALRLSTEIAYQHSNASLFTVTPFFRDNQTKLMPSWMLTYDANDRDYQFQSYGLLAKYRYRKNNLELITGVDVDYTPTTYKEIKIATTKDADGNYVSTAPTGDINYDYDAKQLAVSPYVHGEWKTSDRVKLTGGLRYDRFDVDYTDNLSDKAVDRRHLRPESQKISYDSLSPKLGVNIALVKPNKQKHTSHNLYANYRHSFRVPSIGSLFRSGSTPDTDTLKPVKTDSYEIGTRGQFSKHSSYELALYHMTVNDDIVSYIDNSTNARKRANAGETTHQGVELTLKGKLTDQLSAQLAASYTKQKYDDFTATVGRPATEINFAGNDVAKAPKTLGNLSLAYTPSALPNATFEAELMHVGNYFVDETNTETYGGHNLVNLRANYQVNDNMRVFGRVLNVTDKRHSTYTSKRVGSDAVQYRTGAPRSVYVGIEMGF